MPIPIIIAIFTLDKHNIKATVMTDYISANMWQLWGILAVVCLVLELFTGGFFIICFAVGAAFALLASFIGGIYVQLGTFVLFSAVSIFLVRPFAVRYLHRNEDRRVSNADAIIGRVGTVSQSIVEGGYGRVAIDGDDWKAESENHEGIAEGSKVEVVGRESIIIKVKKV